MKRRAAKVTATTCRQPGRPTAAVELECGHRLMEWSMREAVLQDGFDCWECKLGPSRGGVLREMLQLAVPLWVHQHSERHTWTTLAEEVRRCSGILAEKGDVLQFGGKGCREAFNALASALAGLSFCPGGAKFVGLRWESDLRWLREAEA